jgi:hypothetical protein
MLVFKKAGGQHFLSIFELHCDLDKVSHVWNIEVAGREN